VGQKAGENVQEPTAQVNELEEQICQNISITSTS